KAFILCIVTGLMSRVHEKIREADEICYVDASASFEPLNTSITLLYTSCIAGALLLGLLITSDELEMTIENEINLLKLILPKHAFFGRGCDIGPQNVVTDDSASERNALKLCWPQSNLLLCTIHILQAFWHWLYNSKHDIIFARTKAYNSVQRRLYRFAHRHPSHMEIAKRFLCPSWEDVDKDSICELANSDDYLVPSTRKETGLIYNINSAIGTCDCPIGMSGAPCKHQGAVAMKYHIRIINFLPSFTPNDRMTFSYIASGLHVKDCSFYASLRTKPALIENNTTKDNDNIDPNAITIANNMDKEFSEPDDQEVDFDGSSLNDFLQEIEDDYKTCGTQLRAAFDKFAERYKAAKSRSIVQPESVKRRRTNIKQRTNADKENDYQEIPK
ncbi:31479_t:CDS:2, partial [Gigaspora margarita]